MDAFEYYATTPDELFAIGEASGAPHITTLTRRVEVVGGWVAACVLQSPNLNSGGSKVPGARAWRNTSTLPAAERSGASTAALGAAKNGHDKATADFSSTRRLCILDCHRVRVN